MAMRLIDVHAHVGSWAFPLRSGEIVDVKEHMKLCNIEQSIVSHSSAIMYDFVEGNYELAKALESEDSIWGYVVLNPYYLELSLEQLARYGENPRFVGVKLHPEQQAYRLIYRNVLGLLEKVAERELPVLVHTFPGQVEDLCVVARQFPTIKFIMGHMGGDNWVAGLEAVADIGNIYLEPCCSFPDAGKLETAVGLVGAKRVVFGTDSTLLNPAFLLGLLQDANLTDEARQRIACTNALDIFEFPHS